MYIEQSLKNHLQTALQEIYGMDESTILLQPTKKDFEGFYTFVTFSYSKLLRKSPVEIGNALGAYLAEKCDLVSDFNVAQGFLNIGIKDNAWVTALNELATQPNFGFSAPNGQSVMVEFSSPNTNKPLHLGHLRTNFLGDSVARILKANGYQVTKTCLVNDRGIHICKSMLAYQKFGNGETPQSAGMKGDHLIGKYYVLFDKAYKDQIETLVAQGANADEAKKTAPLMQEAQAILLKWEQNDPETMQLWQQMNEWVYAGFAETYQKIGVSFDKTYYESKTYLLGKTVVEEGLAQEVFFKKDDGSVWIDLTAEGLDQKLVLRGDGTSVYITQDLGTTDLKFSEFQNDRSIWVVGNEQDYHFKVLFAIMKRLGRTYADGCYHLSYGMVDLPSGKMKSREGTVVDADELVSEVTAAAAEEGNAKGKIDDMTETEKQRLFSMLGLGALKYYLLKVDPQKRILYNPAESVELHGHTGPFIQYTHARTRSVLRKATQLGIDWQKPAAEVVLTKSEQEVIFCLTQFPERIADAARNYSPALLSQYAYDLAKAYNTFYADVSILQEPNAAAQKTRLLLSQAAADTIQKTMNLLGIEVPERM
ncbi:MAG: arginine--tRNA ligase [Cytophagia bacterium]|nr:MAG: arginine--tRNA ligase [Runella sp.]TAG22924.1 MAG: arginine--tRNA ligase [Cytophagales bacterium]TAG41979.1 MAG: arginine--tRNA ligase [Cytophagia bacterium]TAG51501.1 MAG: arginine--tRNA ligase [Runella slithyformis]TAG82447.1 MAG: arginine--tRNA ligase [Cytophagales bacterium]